MKDLNEGTKGLKIFYFCQKSKLLLLFLVFLGFHCTEV